MEFLQTDWIQSKGCSRNRNYKREYKNVTYDSQLCPINVKSNIAPNAKATHQIDHRHYEQLKSSSPDSQALGNPI